MLFDVLSFIFTWSKYSVFWVLFNYIIFSSFLISPFLFDIDIDIDIDIFLFYLCFNIKINPEFNELSIKSVNKFFSLYS